MRTLLLTTALALTAVPALAQTAADLAVLTPERVFSDPGLNGPVAMAVRGTSNRGERYFFIGQDLR